MKLTDEQRIAVYHDDHALVVACPGSGKTRSIIARLLRSIDAVRGSTRRVTCITYTNAAVHEIENRVRIYGSAGDDEYCDVSTIHAFCQNNILRHFHWKLDEFHDGFTVLHPTAKSIWKLYVISLSSMISTRFRVKASNCSIVGRLESR